MEDFVYMKVTKDKYRLPLAIADSAEELARICNVSKGCIFSSISHGKNGENRSYIKVKL